MKVKLGDLKAIEDVVVKLVNDVNLPIKYALDISKVIDSYERILSNFERYRVALVHKYGQPDNEGAVQVPDSRMPAFGNAFKELINTEVEFEPVNIPKEILEEAGVKVTLSELSALLRVGFIRNDLTDGEDS